MFAPVKQHGGNDRQGQQHQHRPRRVVTRVVKRLDQPFAADPKQENERQKAADKDAPRPPDMGVICVALGWWPLAVKRQQDARIDLIVQHHRQISEQKRNSENRQLFEGDVFAQDQPELSSAQRC